MKNKLFILIFIISFCKLYAAPSVTITSSQIGTTFRGGDTYTFSGFATHSTAGVLNNSSFRWKVNYRHDDHWHDNFDYLIGDSLFSFTISEFNLDPSPDVFFTIQLIVTALGANGMEEKTEQINIYPITSTVTITSSPIGIKFDLGKGSINTTPTVFGATELTKFSLYNYLDVQTINGIAYKFKNWSNCSFGARTTLTITESDQLISINYEPLSSFTTGLGTNCVTSNEVNFEISNFNVFPNPASDFIYLDNKAEDVEIYSLIGQKQYCKQ